MCADRDALVRSGLRPFEESFFRRRTAHTPGELVDVLDRATEHELALPGGGAAKYLTHAPENSENQQNIYNRDFILGRRAQEDEGVARVGSAGSDTEGLTPEIRSGGAGPQEMAFIKLAALGELRDIKMYIRAGIDVNAMRPKVRCANGPAGWMALAAIHTLLVPACSLQAFVLVTPQSALQVGGALHIAARNGQAEIVKILLEAGADRHLPDDSGRYPIHYAVTSASMPCFKLLLLNEANLRESHMEAAHIRDADGNNLLHTAVFEGSAIEVVEHLIELGVDLQARNSAGRTPIEAAEMRLVQEASSNAARARHVKQIKDVLEDKLASKLKQARSRRISTTFRRPNVRDMPYPPPVLDDDDDARLMADWLDECGVANAVEVMTLIRAGGFNYDTLYKLDEAELVELGVSKVGARNKILDNVRYLQGYKVDVSKVSLTRR